MLQGPGIGVEHRRQRAEALQQAAGQRLDIAPRDRAHQQQLDNLVVAQGIDPAGQ